MELPCRDDQSLVASLSGSGAESKKIHASGAVFW